jgi:hypothetical protein
MKNYQKLKVGETFKIDNREYEVLDKKDRILIVAEEHNMLKQRAFSEREINQLNLKGE